MNQHIKLIIAGGKTGGHLFPGIATAQAIERLHPDTDILFVGTRAPFEMNTLKKYGYAHKSIISRPIKGGSILKKIASMSIIFVSLAQSMVILKDFKPDFVMGVGGFSSFAVVLAAWTFGIPTAIQEQNAIPGLTNRMLSRFAKTIFTSFKVTKGLEDNPKVAYVGNPVRKSDTSVFVPGHDLNNFDPKKFTLLVTGGSQGASSINAAFTDALSTMKDVDRFNIIHQTGVKDELEVQKKYSDLKITATARAFFHNMQELLGLADLAVTRAGAGTIFELCTMGLPAILVPFPHAADDHQTFNARALEEQGAAVLLKDGELTGPVLKKAMEHLIRDKKKLEKMAQHLKQLAMPDADEKIATTILRTKELKA